MNANTKLFANSFGVDKPLTRDEYIQRWIEPTHQLGYILGAEGSLDKLNELQNEITRLAGIRWDNA